MFCRKCGLKIVAGEKKCRKCGEPVNTAEYCGGFWGILGEEADQERDRRDRLSTDASGAQGLPAGKMDGPVYGGNPYAGRTGKEANTEDLSKVSQAEISEKREYEKERERLFQNRMKELKMENQRLRDRVFKTGIAVVIAGILALVFMISTVRGLLQIHQLKKTISTQKESATHEMDSQPIESEQQDTDADEGPQSEDTVSHTEAQEENLQQETSQETDPQQEKIKEGNLRQGKKQEEDLQQENTQEEDFQQENTQEEDFQQENTQEEDPQQGKIKEGNLQQENTQKKDLQKEKKIVEPGTAQKIPNPVLQPDD